MTASIVFFSLSDAWYWWSASATAIRPGRYLLENPALQVESVPMAKPAQPISCVLNCPVDVQFF